MTDFDSSTRMVFLLIVGLGLFELGREMRESCPPMADIRQSSNEPHMLQHMIDGEAHTGIIVAGAALVSWWAAGSVVPALVLLGTYAALVWYNHSVLAAPAAAY